MNDFRTLCIRIAILVVCIFLASGAYFYFNTPGYDRSKLYQVSCGDIFAGTDLETLIQCEGTTADRRRLDFAALASRYPEIGARVVILRDRVRELETLSQQTANWALNWHLRFVAVSIVLLAFVALFSQKETAANRPNEGRFGIRLGHFAPSVAALAVLLYAIGQSFAFHTKYHAAFVAAQQFQALAVAIDAELIDVVSSVNAGGVNEENSRAVTLLVQDWADALLEVQTKFADTYGSSFALISTP